MPILYAPAGKAGEYAALAANLYRGCTHGCAYCYAPAALRQSHRRAEFHAASAPRAEVLLQLEKDARKAAQAGERREVLLSFTSDPYQPCEEGYRVTRKALEILTRHGLAVTVLTKGGLLSCRDFDLLGRDPRNAYATTLTCADPETSARWEPGARPPAERIEALRRAKAAGIRTWVSLEPVLDPAAALELVDRTHEVVDLYKVGKLNYHPHASSIDWPTFRTAIVERLEAHASAYYLKRDLREAA